MASKFGLAGGIPERRARPIWDAVDTRQYKNAMKLTTALLSKYPNSPYALALKALILERTGKNEEALSVCLNAKEILCSNDPSVFVDDLTLSTLQIVFQRLEHLEMATSCYEHACTKYPNNLELMVGLFNCYVREYSFVKQQQMAIKMYKAAGEERFLLWAVCSIQLQVCCGNGEKKLLQLAEGLLKKHIASHGLHDPAALSVYISVLEQQCKYGDAFEILSGKLGSLMGNLVEKYRLQLLGSLCLGVILQLVNGRDLKGRLLAKAGDYAAASDMFQKVIELRPDDWESFRQCIGCLLEDDSILNKETDPMYPLKSIECKNLRIPDDLFDLRISNAANFVQKLTAEGKNNSERGPLLAFLEIERRKLLFGKGDGEKVVEDLIQYFIRFGHLPCFTSDVENFLQLLDDKKKSEFLKKLVKECEASTSVETKALGQSISVFKVQSLIGDVFSLPVKELEDIAVRMTGMFCKNLPLSKDLDVQESVYGEELLTLACNILVQLFWRTRDFGYLLESIMVLEFGLAIRRHVWQYKILLLHLYSYWSALPLAYERYKSLNVKNMLLETVSHHILPDMLVSPLWADLNDLLREYLKFMHDHLVESADLTFIAYRHRNYSKVIEFVQFKERLRCSSQYLLLKIESAILQLKQNSNNIVEEESILGNLNYGTHFIELSKEIRSKSLTFNEDMTLRPWWTPTPDKSYLLGPFEGVSYFPRENMHNQIKQTEVNTLKTIEKRSLVPRMIYLSIHSASATVKENIEANGSIIDPKLTSDLKILLECYAKILEFPFQDAVELVSGLSSDEKLVEVNYPDVIDWINFAVFLNAWNLNSHEIKFPDKTNSSSSTWNLVNNLLREYVQEKISTVGHTGNDIPFLVQLVTEPLSWHALIIQSCARSLLPSGKKKKKGGSVEPSNSKLSLEIQNSIKSLIETVEIVTKWLKEQLQKPNGEKFEKLFTSIKRNGKSDGPGKVLEILESSVSVMKDVELGGWVPEGLQSWNPADVVRKIVSGQDGLLSEFLKICELKIKSLKALKN